MNAIEIETTDTPSTGDTGFIFRRLVDFNETRTQPASARELAVLARCGPEIVAGLIGFTHWNWLHVRYLWVGESFRRQGLGRLLVTAAEHEARIRGCEHAHLDTFSFQAVPFYEHLGYLVFGRVEDYPAGHTRVFLQKRNLPR